MKIWEDVSYIQNDLWAVEAGYAKISTYRLRLDADNFDLLYDGGTTRPELTLARGYSRNITREERERRVNAVCDALDKKYKIHQYDKDDREKYPYGDYEWDLFFWCNCLERENWRRDFSYVTLSFNNKKMDYEARMKFEKEVLEFIQSLDIDIDVAVQRHLEFDDDAVRATVRRYCEDNLGKMLIYKGMEGKIVWNEQYKQYVFMKKRVRKYCYPIDADSKAILWLAVQEKKEVA